MGFSTFFLINSFNTPKFAPSFFKAQQASPSGASHRQVRPAYTTLHETRLSAAPRCPAGLERPVNPARPTNCVTQRNNLFRNVKNDENPTKPDTKLWKGTLASNFCCLCFRRRPWHLRLLREHNRCCEVPKRRKMASHHLVVLNLCSPKTNWMKNQKNNVQKHQSATDKKIKGLLFPFDFFRLLCAFGRFHLCKLDLFHERRRKQLTKHPQQNTSKLNLQGELESSNNKMAKNFTPMARIFPRNRILWNSSHFGMPGTSVCDFALALALALPLALGACRKLLGMKKWKTKSELRMVFQTKKRSLLHLARRVKLLELKWKKQ